MSDYDKKFFNACNLCNNNDFVEDEFGCLACTQCGSLSKNHIKVELDYEDVNKRMRNRMKKVNNEEENDCEMEVNNEINNIEEEFTNCNTSIMCDSEIRISNNNIKEKSINEIFHEYQEIFIKLNKLFYITNKNLCYFKIIQPDEDLNIYSAKTNYSTQQHYENLMYSQNNNNSENNFNDSDYKNIFDVSKIIWFDLINKEFQNQNKSTNRLKKKFRSRKHTEETKEKMTKEKYKEELKSRKLKEKNIIEIDDYKSLNLRKKEKVLKFIDEYDQVKNDFTQNDLNYENVLKSQQNKNLSFEEAIHRYFTEKSLDYKMLHSEKKFDELNSNLNNDNILSLINIIFIISNNFFFSKDFIYSYRRFDLLNSETRVEMSELKHMKYVNKERFWKLCDKHRKDFNVTISFQEFFIKTCNIIEMPQIFMRLCIKLYEKMMGVIEKNVNHIYTHENFMIAIIIYAIKLLYGLNDLPYLIFLDNENLNPNQINDSRTREFIESIIRGLELVNIYGPKDWLFKIIKELPSLQNLLKKLSNLIKTEKESNVIWEGSEFKKNYQSKYKENFKNFAEKVWFNKQGNTSLLNKVNEIKTNKLFNSSHINNKLNTKVKFSNKFAQKLQKKHEIDGIMTNNFLNEELEFYDDLQNIYKEKIGKKLEVPLPCDTIIKFHRQAYKFDGITPPESELIVYFFFKNFFKIDYQVLRKCNKIVEQFVNEKLG